MLYTILSIHRDYLPEAATYKRKYIPASPSLKKCCPEREAENPLTGIFLVLLLPMGTLLPLHFSCTFRWEEGSTHPCPSTFFVSSSVLFSALFRVWVTSEAIQYSRDYITYRHQSICGVFLKIDLQENFLDINLPSCRRVLSDPTRLFSWGGNFIVDSGS